MRATLLFLTLLVPVVAGAQVPQPISPVDCLRKIALDLTDRAPSADELAALAAGTKSLADLADDYLHSAEFSQVVFNWFRGTFPLTAKMPSGVDVDEPARIARYIVTNDRDFRELVTGQYTVDETGAQIDRGASAAGALSTQNYLTAFQGIANRNWAGRLLRGMTGIVLMQSSVVPPGVDGSREGLAAVPACASCHTHPVYGVDFAAAFRDCFDELGAPIATCSSPQIAFLGQKGTSLADLGKILAGSVEWRAKMIQTFYSRLFGRTVGNNELPQYYASEAAWIAAGYRPLALLEQIVTSSQYCAR